jgi:hypothetical protein
LDEIKLLREFAEAYGSVNESPADDAARCLMSLGPNEVSLVEKRKSKHELETTLEN